MINAVFVTGGAGFIGSHLCEKLLLGGKKVFALDNLSTGRMENIQHLISNGNFKFTKGSVLDKDVVDKMANDADEVYHLAAAVGVKTIMEKPLESWILNIEGTENVLNAACKRKTPVLIASTSEIYGKNTKVPFGEDDDRVYGSVKNYRWGYAFSKGVDEFLALAYFREKGLPARIARFFNTIGPRQTGIYGMVVPRFIQQALKNEPIMVYGDGNQTRCFGYVKDVVGAVIALMERDDTAGEVYNLGSDEEISINELAKMVIKLTGSKSKIAHIPYSDVYPEGFEDMARRKPDLSKVKRSINYKPTVNIDGILKEIVDFEKNRL
ncbi:MAG: nucleoside-diphosphate sugar epimerase [Candidatus Spechtbacteria bacterium RIFCSPHIGHO2_02_FULL_43_15b]|uniref:UDP-glucuronate decarboxylase n=1 Tax=Candidatus Spechtbacteria bacterium RIFCSPHIGHO2_01_FULL_43_30 TaxID=1802158 RepID=A0A1G2H606_9BACT|nr:MAG: nucleoside-diphosphate sugar epimerase [Candidatus Spechtbacteria bacterium RIFCSPHIGHO2_01_FULL_43_30]OGZ59054.1 MAG: nucleoside-diphosphate sugar epimerase [Candidatus Spechtbacteria bacterium RIFCSPHIGHO2_02_FULL_43_15b]